MRKKANKRLFRISLRKRRPVVCRDVTKNNNPVEKPVGGISGRIVYPVSPLIEGLTGNIHHW